MLLIHKSYRYKVIILLHGIYQRITLQNSILKIQYLLRKTFSICFFIEFVFEHRPTSSVEELTPLHEAIINTSI